MRGAMSEINKRTERRFRFCFSVQYEAALEGDKFALPITVPAIDISAKGMSFYVTETMQLHSNLRVSCVLEGEKIFFIGRVVRMELTESGPFKFLIGVEISQIEPNNKKRIEKFIERIDIRNALKDIPLEHVVDIHFVSGYPPIIKKIAGMEVSRGNVLKDEILSSLLVNLLDDDRYKEFMREKEANFVFTYKEGVRFRVNLHVQRDKIEGVFRLIPSQVQLLSELGLPASVESLLVNKKGLILVAGRTGSGKSTTLASMVQSINNKRKGIIITVEKPIEFIHTNKECFIKQREVGRDTLSFSAAAKNALRQNPDVLLIGEILDVETMEVVITAAESGMLVLSSIHAPDSTQALDRVVSFFPADMQKHMLTRLSLILKGVVTQDLIPRRDGTGLVVAAEVLVVNDALRRIVRDGDWRQIPNVIQTGSEIGMQSMRSSLEQYFLNGIIDGEYFKEYM